MQKEAEVRHGSYLVKDNTCFLEVLASSPEKAMKGFKAALEMDGQRPEGIISVQSCNCGVEMNISSTIKTDSDL